MTNPAEVSFPVVPQRRAAKMAESKKETIKTYKDRKSISGSRESTSSAPASPPSPTSSLSSVEDEVILIPPSAHPPPTRQLPSPSITPLRTASKRSAAQAAQQNIQQLHQSYADFDGFDTTNIASSSKKKRLSTGVLTKVEQNSSSEPSVPSSAPSTTTYPGKAARKKVAQSTFSAARSPAAIHGRRFQDDQGVVWELQVGTCQAAQNKQWRKCVHCITKRAGDTCRFVDFRAFRVDPHTDQITPPDQNRTSLPAFLFSPDSDEVMDLPTARLISTSHLSQVQGDVARALLPVLEAELEHARLPNVLRRPREKTCRQMCEFCATSIFSASWFCRRCGREYCADCKRSIEHSDSLDRQLAKRILRCDQTLPHATADLVPLTRFDEALLHQEVSAMRNMLTDVKTGGVRTSAPAHPAPAAAASTSNEAEQSMPGTEDEQHTAVNWKDVPTNQAGITADRIVGRLDLRTFDSASFSTDDFRREWAHGEPLLVRHVTEPMHHPWGPDALQSRYGHEHCFIVRSDVENAELKQVSVGDFFATFGQDDTTKRAALGRGHWKLKDWPPSAEFKAEFPELYDDFNRVVPAPDYTTREGVLNLGSCYPTGVIQPDLGPKMYNAWPGSEAPGGNGTTRLHMDIADAVNIMLHASPPTGEDVPDEHRPGVAAWDIFRADDADKLRAFLRKEYSHIEFRDDPIHIQRFFIDAQQRVKLYQEYGVRSWRIYQKAGEAVFIPAGCAHQVCNLADCIKVAVDFVSPQNVDRCFKLTAEFRELVQDYKKAWKEDVLSLRTTLWYAWCTYRQMDGQGPNVWAKQKREVKDEGEAQMQKITRRVLQAQ